LRRDDHETAPAFADLLNLCAALSDRSTAALSEANTTIRQGERALTELQERHARLQARYDDLLRRHRRGR
jgi:hypothetical protein